MSQMKRKKSISMTWLHPVVVAVAALLLAPVAHAAAPGITGPTFNLVATDSYISQPDGASVYSWGYGLALRLRLRSGGPDARAAAQELLDLALVAIPAVPTAEQRPQPLMGAKLQHRLPRRVAEGEAAGLQPAVVQTAARAQLPQELQRDGEARAGADRRRRTRSPTGAAPAAAACRAASSPPTGRARRRPRRSPPRRARRAPHGRAPRPHRRGG